MKNKYLIAIIGALLFIGFIGSLAPFFGQYGLSIFNYIYGVASFIGLFLIYKNGTIRKIRTYRIWLGFVVLLAVWGCVFKIQHYPFAYLMILGGSLGVLLVYSVHFFHKKNKKFVDYCKIVWLYLWLISSTSIILHYPFGREIGLISSIVFLILYFLFARTILSISESEYFRFVINNKRQRQMI
jgi:hypothetical protein